MGIALPASTTGFNILLGDDKTSMAVMIPSEISLTQWLALCAFLDPQPPYGTLELMLCLNEQGYFGWDITKAVPELKVVENEQDRSI